ncbi:antitoxin HipB [Roseovarius sp. A-2]|uniref:helix-turn-helix domain-containing protein n=1 Tax=Roseovarius sp. A-2 TaxID=1570360 RepID=UPI0009B53971|nr:helix-turn-helix transcriptional regulator [Roseovarius sp. A-2]MAM41074.1 XRE family transcriptional regulator [Erythrobacter sp.]GAW36494.1 antitoxin HipB [Roseovarius sp. A-2]
MSYATEHIAESLKAARERKGLSQRALSAKAGVPQSHISKIENGAVDLRLSSLVELARVLDLELTLVPRKKLPAVRAIIRGDDGRRDVQSARKATNLLQRLDDQIAALPSETLSEIVVQELQRRARELMHFKLSADDLVQLQEASASMQEFLSDPRNLEAVEQAQSQLRMLRNALAHGAGASAPSLPRPAYRLDGDDHG